MSEKLSFASWNVEHFHGKPDRVERVVDLISAQSPDIFALYEVKGKDIFSAMSDAMSDYNFFITERKDKSDMEILVGVKNSLPVFVTQRDEFRSKVPTLRPGTLATVSANGSKYCFLFLHMKSFNDPRSWGLRDDMFLHCAHLKNAIAKGSSNDERPKLIILGDMNTMGLDIKFESDKDLSEQEEIELVEKRMRRAKMRLLGKTHERSWWNGKDKYKPGSRLDHVFADQELNFRKFDNGAEIKVIGWPEKATDAKRRKWIDTYSDHAMLYGEILH